METSRELISAWARIAEKEGLEMDSTVNCFTIDGNGISPSEKTSWKISTKGRIISAVTGVWTMEEIQKAIMSAANVARKTVIPKSAINHGVKRPGPE